MKRLDMYLNRHRKVEVRPATERELYNRMRQAIERIEALYDPSLSFDGHHEVRKEELDRMSLYSLERIAAWEAGWIQLLSEIKPNRRAL